MFLSRKGPEMCFVLLFQQEWFPLSAWTGAGGRLQGKPRQEPVASSLGVHSCGVAAP